MIARTAAVILTVCLAADCRGSAAAGVRAPAAAGCATAGGACCRPTRGRAGAGAVQRGPQPLPFENHDGFTSIFDGTTLKGWDGDPKFWRVEAGAIVGQTTAENKLTENTFVIWRGGEPADFELKLEYRINATNSGIQVRSTTCPPAPTAAAADRSRASGS